MVRTRAMPKPLFRRKKVQQSLLLKGMGFLRSCCGQRMLWNPPWCATLLPAMSHLSLLPLLIWTVLLLSYPQFNFWADLILYSCSIPSVIQTTTQMHMLLPPNLTQMCVLLSISFASKLYSSQFSKQRCTWQRQERAGSWEVHLQALLPGEIRALT